MSKKYRKKPVVVDAVQFDGTNYKECEKFLDGNYDNSLNYPNIKTVNGRVPVHVNDYIVKTIRGDFYPCEPKLFEEMHEEVT